MAGIRGERAHLIVADEVAGFDRVAEAGADAAYDTTAGAEAQVTTQFTFGRRAVRYGYTITFPDGGLHVSDYRYHSAASAQRAGEADLAATLAVCDDCGQRLTSHVEAGTCPPEPF